ncbi:MAG: hypothetical protein JKY50_04120 [Oleispira sp.]|nr:hypothetical protein [Oleispira sp.]
MLRLKKSFQHIALVALGTSALIGCGGNSSNSTTEAYTPIVDSDSCFWVGPYSKDIAKTNFAFPDDGARYWHAGYNIPTGATLKLNGQYPHARYMSLNSYLGGELNVDAYYAAPAHAIADAAMVPNAGSINPFVDGANRNSEHRDYQVTLAAGNTPETVPANTLYGNAQGDDNTVIIYRIYVADTDQGIQGGVALPEAELTLENGEVLTGDDACAALNVDTDIVDTPFIADAAYQFLRGSGNPAQKHLNEDGKTVTWNSSYNATYANQCNFLNICEDNPVRLMGYYANLDNQYAAAWLDREIKPVVVIRGKIPNVPATLSGEATFDDSQSQLRYWSICQNEYFSQKVTECLYDEQIHIQPDGKYLIVTSLLEDKPSNLTSSECPNSSMGFIEWSKDGDGFGIREGRENNSGDGLLLVRNMLPSAGFNQAVQNTATPGDERGIMGDFLPTAEYFTKAEFEALGCDAYNSL